MYIVCRLIIINAFTVCIMNGLFSALSLKLVALLQIEFVEEFTYDLLQ